MSAAATHRLALGMDVSTAEVRVTVLDLDAAIEVAGAATALPAVTGTGGLRVQDVDYALLARTVIDEALSDHVGDQVVAISITATSGTVVPIDSMGRQSGIAVMYDDARGLPFERLLPQGKGRPISMLGRIMALAAAHGDFRAASVAQVIGTVLVGHEVGGDTSHFLKTGIDPSETAWPGELLADARLRDDVLPVLVQPGTTLGSVVDGAAGGALLVAGMTDGCTSQLASGAVRNGQSVGVLGTTLVLKSVAAVDHWDAATGIYAHRAPDGAYWLGGASNVGGGSVQKPDGLDYAEAEHRARALGPSPIVRYPLARRGERFPVADAEFEAFAIDLDGSSSGRVPAVVTYRAGLEGVAMVERLALETLGLDASASPRVLSGGGTRNRLWNEIRAATLGAVVRIPTHGDSGYGAAVLAGWAAGDEPFAEVVDRFTKGGELIDPDPELTVAMAERYAVFTAALASARGSHR
ncbi:MAG TPA: FGGY-family carbohydrate kinase [Galbitalea sp.]|jgi:xylulokinase|nr:FGGY-family carbohydrate kinase [Galbitalea sp.]